MAVPIAWLFAAEAGGMVMDFIGSESQIDKAREAEKVDQANIQNEINLSKLQTEEASLQSMKTLRQNLGTQAAVLAARGTQAGTGSAAEATEESIGNFNADARIRKINELSKEAQLRAGAKISDMHEQIYESNVWNEFAKNSINQIPVSAWGSALSNNSKTPVGNGFSFTPVGGAV
jgi:hypothetical protein